MLAANTSRCAQRILSRASRNACILRGIQAYYRRDASTSNFHPIIREFAGELGRHQPSFYFESQDIRILQEPKEFADTLLEMVKRAKSRIFISSLYIGSKETQLIDSLRDALLREPELHVYLQLDLNRSTRPGEASTASILLPLLREFPDRIHVSLFRSPHLRGLMAKIVPPRFNEGWGTWHAKVYGADDEVMISGANLNKSYFTDRQDRYLHFRDQAGFAQYCFDFLKLASTFSFHLQPSAASDAALTPHSYVKENYTVVWPDPDTHPHDIHGKVHAAFSQFQKDCLQKAEGTEQPGDDAKVHIYPLIQAGQFGIREEENMFALLFKHLRAALPSRPLLDFTSGYFSVYKPYQDMILESPNVDCRVVAASPKANGFYGSAGPSGLIPEGYTLYEQRFMAAVARASRLWQKDGEQGHGVLLSEWTKIGWTYHAKGIWLSPDSSSKPILTLFGSTNLNARSAHLDTELSFVMIVPSATPTCGGSISEQEDSENLRARLAQEVAHIRQDTEDWKGATRKVRVITKLLVKLLKGML